MAKKIKIKPEAIKKYKAWLKMAIAKRDRRFTPVANRAKSYYKGQFKPDWSDDEDSVFINMVFPNTEIIKPSIFFRNPRIFIKPTQDKFILEDGRTLDGAKAGKLIEDAVNYIAYSNGLQREVKKVRNDAIMLTYGVMFSGYEGETGVNEDGETYIRKDSIYSLRISPYKFLVDPEATDCLEFSDARWVAREIDLRFNEFKQDDWYENRDKAKSDATGYGEKLDKEGRKIPLIEFAGKDYKDTEDAKRITLYEIWIRPTPAEKKKLKKDENGGRIVVLSMSNDEPHKVLRWPYKIKNPFPFRGLAFFRDNDEFYPISDVAQYEQQLNELSKIRTAQLKHIKTFGDKKVFIDKSIFDSEEELTKLNEAESGPFIGVNIEGDIRNHVFVLQFGSAPSEMFIVDKKVQDDMDKISGINDMRRGIPISGIETATEAERISGFGGTRLVEMKSDVADFYQDIARMYVQFIKQYWTTETMVRRLGTLTPEWTDNFSSEDIQIEDDVEVDIGEMVPVNEVVRKKQALDYLEMIVKGATDPSIRAKLAEEGYELSLAEAIKEAIIAFGMKNENIIQRLTPEKYVRVLKELMAIQMKGAQPEETPAARGSSGRRGEGPRIPSSASELSRANRGTGRHLPIENV